MTITELDNTPTERLLDMMIAASSERKSAQLANNTEKFFSLSSEVATLSDEILRRAEPRSTYTGLSRFTKRFNQFCDLIRYAEKGKTFIYFHPKMVAIDMKSWQEIQSKLKPKIQVYYDEYDKITPDRMAEIEKITKNWISKAFKK